MAFGINVPVGFKVATEGLNGAKEHFKSFGESVKHSLELIGVAASFKEIFDLAKESLKLAGQDLKSRKLLELQIKNSTHTTLKQAAANEKFLDTLSMQVGITKNELRPALGNAVRSTGDLQTAQNLLKIALNGASASGKPLGTVLNVLLKAHNGNTKALYKLAPELKKTKGLIKDYAAEVRGAARASANPFDRFQIAIDELKVKFGELLLPMVTKFVDFLTKNVVPAVSDFLDQVGNPKTDAGKVFVQIQKAVNDAFQGVSQFFGLFANGDGMKGFTNVVGALVKAMPALAVLKGILVLNNAAGGIQTAIDAASLIAGRRGGGGVSAVGEASKILTLAGPVKFLATGAVALMIGADWAGKNRDAKLVQAGINPADYVASQANNPYAGRVNFTGTTASYQAFQAANGVKVTQPVNVTVNSYGSTPAQFNSLILRAIEEHNRLNGKKP
jgi:hypothetical protein